MTKFCGKIGYAYQEETDTSVWTESYVEKPVYGEIMRYSTKSEKGYDINENLVVSNKVRVVADPYARENLHHMKYIRTSPEGVAWSIKSVDVEFPGLVLTLGGEYNVQTERIRQQTQSNPS